MPYAPRSLSYLDGLDDGARKERRRIVSLLEKLDTWEEGEDTLFSLPVNRIIEIIEGETDAN
jgi:hypothetical protein